MRQLHEPEARVSALDKHQNWSASGLFCPNSRAQTKYAVINLIHIRQKEHLRLFNVINKNFYQVQKSFEYYQLNEITRKVNESILQARECTLRYANARERCSECKNNARALLSCIGVFHVRSYQANFASHHTRDRHDGFYILLPLQMLTSEVWNSICNSIISVYATS